jgi:hypothetical protein
MLEKWHTDSEISEAAFFERIAPYSGGDDSAVLTGAIFAGGRLLIPSSVLKFPRDTLLIRCMDLRGNLRTLVAHEGCTEILASSISLAWG